MFPREGETRPAKRSTCSGGCQLREKRGEKTGGAGTQEAVVEHNRRCRKIQSTTTTATPTATAAAVTIGTVGSRQDAQREVRINARSVVARSSLAAANTDMLGRRDGTYVGVEADGGAGGCAGDL
jgi:hypothetical protein